MPGHLTDKEIDAIHEALLKEKSHFKRQLNDMGGSGVDDGFDGSARSAGEEVLALRESTQELSTYDNHPADIGSETYEREKDAGLREQASYFLREIDNALRKIEEVGESQSRPGVDADSEFSTGMEKPLEFGLCERCNAPISKERLTTVPYTRYCVNCQNEEDRRQRDSWLHRWGGRPVEETALYAPFGRSFRDETSEIGFDGEDAWQRVAQFGTSESPSDVPGSSGYGDVFIDSDEDVGVVEPVEELPSHAEVLKVPVSRRCCPEDQKSGKKKKSTPDDGTEGHRKP
jgi:RNA polymerase-binding transcription factor DksA